MRISTRAMAFVATVVFAAVLACTATDTKAAVTHTFSSVSEQLMATWSTGFVSLEDEPFTITNDTGVTWIDFHVTLVGDGEFGSYDFMRFDDLGGDGDIYTGPGTESFSDENGDAYGYNEVMDLDGLSIPDGDTLEFTVDIFGGAFPEGLVEAHVYGLPTVPEPCTIAVLGIGGLALLRRRRR